MTNDITPYNTSEEVRIVVKRFEACEFGPGEFHHSHHVTVALCYLLESTEVNAIERMRAGLLRFLEHHGSTKAYHETITVFWIKFVRHQLDQADGSSPLVDLANTVVAKCSNAAFINEHFSKELLGSEDARRKWVDPDLQSLDD